MDAVVKGSKKQGRLVQIDSLRGLAALQVVLFHLTAAYGGVFGWPGARPVVTVTAPQVGVAVFFVISGFVITLTLERSSTPRDFVVSRFARLVPAFWFCLGVTALFIGLTGFNPFGLTAPSLIPNASMLNGLFGAPFVDPDYWTLTRELLFYVLFGSIFYACRKKGFPVPILCWVVLSMLYNVTVADEHYFACSTAASCGAIVFNTMFSYLFAAGAMVYELSRGRRDPVIFVTLGLSFVAATVSEWPTHHHPDLIPAAKAVLYTAIVYLAARGFLKPLAFPSLVWLGTISYSLYLIHHVFGFSVQRALLSNGVPVNVAIVATTIFVIAWAAVICFAVERPAQRYLQQRFGRRKRHDLVDAAGIEPSRPSVF